MDAETIVYQGEDANHYERQVAKSSWHGHEILLVLCMSS